MPVPRHHRLKTFHDGWRDEQRDDGTVIWTAPTGQTYRTTPAGADLFPALGACQRPKADGRNPMRDRVSRVTRRRAANRRLRPINAERRYVGFHRRRELEMRRYRNDMRAKRVLFKGDDPITSTLLPWMSDPIEPETLPASWRPPPRTPSLDEPPF
jgi:hypothetical protein